MGVSGWVFLLVLAYLGCPGPKAVKRLCVCVCHMLSVGWTGLIRELSLIAMSLAAEQHSGTAICSGVVGSLSWCTLRWAWSCNHLCMAQLMPLPLTVSCFSKILVGFTFLVLAHPGSPAQRAVKRVCVSFGCWSQGLWSCSWQCQSWSSSCKNGLSYITGCLCTVLCCRVYESNSSEFSSSSDNIPLQQ